MINFVSFISNLKINYSAIMFVQSCLDRQSNEVVQNGNVLMCLDPEKKQQGLYCTGVAPATEPPMPKLERTAQVDKKNSA